MAERTPSPGTAPPGGPDPRLPAGVGIAAVVTVLAVAAVAALEFRGIAAARERLVGPELEALLEAGELRRASAELERVARELVLTGRPGLREEAEDRRAAVRALLARAAARPETATAAGALLAELDGGEPAWRALAGEVGGALPPGAAALERLEREARPAPRRAEAALAEIERARRDAFALRRDELEAEAARGFLALSAVTAVGVLFALLLWGLLRRSIAELRASELRYRTTFEAAPVGIAHVGLDGRFLRLNAHYRALLGYPGDEPLRLSVRALTHPDDVAADEERRARLVAGEIDGYAAEKRYVRKDGTLSWVNITASLVRDRSGAPLYSIAAAEDVAERKAAEEDLREAVAARDEFMHIASHELRTPLTSLRLQVESLRAALARDGGDPVRLEAKAEAALRQVDRLGRMVEGLLDVSRLEESELDLRQEEGDLAAAVREAVERHGPEAQRRHVEVRLDAPAALPLRLDRARVEQAVSHLLSNALKYGQGRPVDVSVRAAGALATVAVRDRGIGIAPQDRERIFGRFERAVPSSHYGGFGLGLFVSRRVAEAHGGSLRAEDAPGGGTTFVLELPLGVAAPTQAGNDE